MESSPNDLENITKGRWQWQSNPWKKGETPKWEFYSLEHNYLIEKAYYDKKAEVDIGDYIVSTRHFIQKKKGNVKKQRPIIRISGTDVEGMDRSERYYETELPKTINPIFGSLEDLVSYMSKRNEEILSFTKSFKDLEQSDSLDILNQKIIPKLVDCLEEVLLKPKEEQLKDSSLSQIKKRVLTKMKEKIEELISPFKKSFASLEEFYGHILRAYTMATDLYGLLNNYLRNENWIEVDKLLPYAFCLCKVFFHLGLKTNLTQDEKKEESKTCTSLLFYRGTAFDEFSLSFYDITKIQYFSWNSVTSTTTNKKVAEEFMFKSVDVEKKKYPVLFIIEVPDKMESEEYLKWLDISQYSTIPKEDEVILAPGSVFELVDVFTDQDKKTTIKVKLKNEVQSLAHRGIMMQGTLQSQMMTEKEAKVLCLDGEDLGQALTSLCGNKLIEELEFGLCTFDGKLLNKILEILPMLEKAKELKFRACIYEGSKEIAIERPKEGERCGIRKIQVIEANGFFQMICNEIWHQKYWDSLKELDLSFAGRKFLKDEELSSAVSQGLKYLLQLTHLKINLEWCQQITNEGVHNLAQGLNHLTQLMDLSLNFEWCQQITDKGVHSLTEGLSSLTKLTHLSLNFKECKQITNTGMKSLSQRLGCFSGLTHLNLSFKLFPKITNVGVNSFSQGIKSLTQLTHLDLDLSWCVQITDKAIESFAQSLNALTQLEHLSLDLRGCKEITEGGIGILVVQGLRNLAELISVNLDIEDSGRIAKYKQEELAYEWLYDLIPSVPMAIDSKTLQNYDIQSQEQFNDLPRIQLVRESFYPNKEALYEAVSLLKLPPMESGESEKSEKLRTQYLINVMACIWRDNQKKPHDRFFEIMQIPIQLDQIGPLNSGFIASLPEETQEERGLKNIASSGLKIKEILSQSHLTFDFEEYSDIVTDEFVHSFSSQVLRKLSKVESLTLIFYRCNKITDEGMRSLSLALYGLKDLAGLTSLKLNFIHCESITDTGLTDLAREGLGYLSQLKSLTLSIFVFGSDGKTTDKGLINLTSYGLRHLSQLETLSLYVDRKISDTGVDELVLSGLKNLTQLKFLILGLAQCEITDKGLNNLVLKAIKSLPRLTYLDLNLYQCPKISAFTVQNLIKVVLPYFGFTKETKD